MLKVKARRLERGLSQQTVGYRTKLHASDISKIERGWMKPRPKQAAKLAKLLDLRPDELLESE